VNQGRRAAAVQVDPLTGAEGDQQLGELGELEAAVEAQAPTVAADGQQLAAADPEPAARVAPDGDVGVELSRGGGEALAVFTVDERAPLETRIGPACTRSPEGSGPSSRRGEILIEPSAMCTQPRADAQGASTGSWATGAPSSRTSPSGRDGSPRKNPATIASDTEVSAHHWSSRRGSAKQTTRVEVVSNGWRTT
jgi:hypothetical protein